MWLFKLCFKRLVCNNIQKRQLCSYCLSPSPAKNHWILLEFPSFLFGKWLSQAPHTSFAEIGLGPRTFPEQYTVFWNQVWKLPSLLWENLRTWICHHSLVLRYNFDKVFTVCSSTHVMCLLFSSMFMACLRGERFIQRKNWKILRDEKREKEGAHEKHKRGRIWERNPHTPPAPQFLLKDSSDHPQLLQPWPSGLLSDEVPWSPPPLPLVI